MSRYFEMLKKHDKRQLSPQVQEVLLTTIGIISIFVLTIGTVFSFESRNNRMLKEMETVVIAGVDK